MTSLASANVRSRIVIVSTVFRVRIVNQSMKQETEVPLLLKCGCFEIMVLAHSGSSIQTGIFSRLPPGSKNANSPVTPRSGLRRICRVGHCDGAGEMGRRPEHSFYPGSGSNT